MRVGFIIPDKVDRWDSVHQGIGYLAAYAQQRQLIDQCAVFRMHGTDQSQLRDFLAQQWDIIGCSVTRSACLELPPVLEAIDAAGSAEVVLGGSHVTTIKADVLRRFPRADYAVVGEGELTFAELLECRKHGGNLSSIKGLIYRDEDGRIRANPPRGLAPNLDLFPYPDRTLFTYPYDFHPMIGTRGCPFRCVFCNSSANWAHRYRVRNPGIILQELKSILDLYGPEKLVVFDDDAFNIKRDWVIEVCNQIEPLHIRWWIRGLRADLVTDDVADAIAGSGCVGAAVGVESADNRCLKAIRKNTTIQRILGGAEKLMSRGIHTIAQFMIGNPADTLQTVQKSLELARRFSESTFGIAYPVPSTELHDFVTRNHLFLPEPVAVKHRGKIIDWILFDTPHFPAQERLAAIQQAILAGVYHNIDYAHSASADGGRRNDGAAHAKAA